MKAYFPPTLVFTKLRFRYLNWRGEEHEYVIIPESVEIGSYDVGGKRPEAPVGMVLHGQVVTRDGDPRPGRRTFIIREIKSLEILNHE